MKDNKHILIIAPSAYPLGGVATWLDYIMPGLEKNGWIVTLGLASGNYHDINNYLKIHPWHNTLEIKNYTGSKKGRVNSLVNIINNQQPDLILGVNIVDCYLAASIIKKKNKVSLKIVMAIHGIQPDLLDDAKNYQETIDGIVTTNKLVCKLLETDSHIKSEKIFYAPYGVPVNEHITPDHHAEQKLRIGYVGRFDIFQKRIEDVHAILNELIKNNFNFEFIIAGDGPDKESLLQSLSNRKFHGVVKYLGHVSQEKMDEQVYNKIDVLLVTSYWETGPIIIWEAMSKGVAVVSSAYIGSGLENGLKHNENCLLYPVGDFLSASESLGRIINSDLRNRLVSNAFNLVKSRYSEEQSIKAWDQSLEKILMSESQDLIKNYQLKRSGRLDRLFGVDIAEKIRNLSGIRFEHRSAGGEWPHSYGKRKIDNPEFWNFAAEMDKTNPTIY